jgi:methionyl-tRNA formyltransferase
MKTVLMGAVSSSRVVLERMVATHFPLSLVLSLDTGNAANASGRVPLHEVARQHGVPFQTFVKANSPEVVQTLRDIAPDYLFVIGLSQLIRKEILDIPSKGVVGFHPTPLPKFRGRAAMVWQVLLGVRETKCSLFLIDEGMDSGPILGQEPYVIGENDYARDVQIKLHAALARLTDRVLAQMLDGTLHPVPQNDEEATILLVRRPEDGHIDWSRPLADVHRLVRAVSRPYPGAFGLYDGTHPVTIWRADILENHRFIGIPGQIARLGDGFFDVLGVDGLLRVTDFSNPDAVTLRVGHKLK